MSEKFNITGMTCSACSARVEKAMYKLEGMGKFSVNLLTNSMVADFDTSKVTSQDIILTIEKAGYGASLVNPQTAQTTQARETLESHENFTLRLWVSFTFLVPLMYVSMGHMMGLPLPSFLEGHHNAVGFAFTQFLLTLPICYINRHYFFKGFHGLVKGNPNMDSLIAIGSSSAMIYGIFAIFRIGYALGVGDMDLVAQYHMDLYFESCATILSLITLGKYFESKSKGKTSEALSKLKEIAPTTAYVEVDGEEQEKDCQDLQVGDIVLVKPGSRIPVDGEVIFGSSAVDQSAITGESIPIQVNVGDKVISATLNKQGFLKICSTKVGNDTLFADIVRLVEEASSSKAPIAKLADKISGIFVPIVISLSLVTGGVWLALGYSFEFALSFAITVLVISCPCALGLATPVAIMVGTGKGAEHGILIKSGEALETAHHVDTVILDKTGTITEGKPQVTDILIFHDTREALCTVAYSLEKQSEHPLGEAICQYCTQEGIVSQPLTEFQAVLGRGVRGTMDNSQYLGGNEAFMTENAVDCSLYKEEIDALAEEGKAPLLFARDSILLGVIGVADPVKSGSGEAIAQLKSMGLQVYMVTGDNQKTAEAIGSTLALDGVVAQVLPQDKERIVQDYQAQGKKVVMVGDGINDAPALIRADVGIAMAQGTDIAMESGDIVLMSGDLNAVVTAISLSKKVISNIKQNLFWAFFYNALGIPLAMGVFYLPFGWRLTPMFAAFAMSFSSLFVVSNALRIQRFQPMTKGIKTTGQGEESGKLEVGKVISKEIQEVNVIESGKKKMITLTIEGMMCGHCVNHVTKALTGVEGICNVAVDLDSKKATMEGDSSLVTEVTSAVVDAGYEVISCDS